MHVINSEDICLYAPVLQVLSNLYGAHMDSNLWNEPDSFKPDRFLDEHGQVVHKEKVIAFSLGKSIPDRQFVNRISFSTVLRSMLYAWFLRFHNFTERIGWEAGLGNAPPS
jgi:hypothetical protein